MDPKKTSHNELKEMAQRIRAMREIAGFSVADMAKMTEVSEVQYTKYESGNIDLPFTFIHKCAQAFNMEITELLEGSDAHLSSYTIIRGGNGMTTAREEGIEIKNLAPLFRNKLGEPYYVKYDYSANQQNEPIHTTTHSGQEFDYILSGNLKVQIGEHIEILGAGDSIFYNSATPHGMIAANGESCVFIAIIFPGESSAEQDITTNLVRAAATGKLVADKFVECTENEDGTPMTIKFKNEDKFNFAFDVVDALAKTSPDKTAMIHLDNEKNERIFTFADMKRGSAQVANYFKSLGIGKGDIVMLVLKRHYQFWFSILALHKLGAIVIPATNQLKEHDFEYRFNAAGVKAIVCAADGDVIDEAEAAAQKCGVEIKISACGQYEGWHDFDSEYPLFSGKFHRDEDTPCGDDPMLMLFTSGTTGYPKIAQHSYKYPLGHYVTAKYWHNVVPGHPHFTISDTGWGKALWGKLYGQWLCESIVFTYDFDRFHASDILPLFKEYNITTFCAPPTMYRMLIKENLSNYDLSSVKHATVAGEALNPEVFKQFLKSTGLELMEGFGQTETTLTIANLTGAGYKIGSMGRAVPFYDVRILDPKGNETQIGDSGEICIKIDESNRPCGLFLGYYLNDEATKEVIRDGYYHTGDVAWKDEDGFFWYVGRVDDVIKSSGYRIGPFEIESVIMELPYVLECGVTAVPDEVRGQIVKACVVLTKGTEGTEELKKAIQIYVKEKTAPYKYPRIVEFRSELPKTISGKIQRNKLK